MPFCPLDPGSGFWGPGWVKNQDPDPGSGSRMKALDNISKSLETNFWVKIIKFFEADPDLGSRNLFDPGPGIQDKHPGSARLCTSKHYIKMGGGGGLKKICKRL